MLTTGAPALADALAAAGLSLQSAAAPDGAPEYLVSGNTFAHRHHIKAQGGRWSRRRQLWVLSSEGAVRALADAVAGGAPPDARPPGLSDTEASSFAAWPSKHYHGHRERLRSRFVEAGSDALADYELLELLLFFSVRVRDTKPLAKAMLARFGSLGGVLAAEPARLAEVDGLSIPRGRDGGPGESGEVAGGSDETAQRFAQDRQFTIVLLKAIQAALERVLKETIKDRPVLGSWTALIDYLRLAMTHEATERFRVLFLDRKNILLKDEVQSRGTVDHTPLYPREVVKRALELGASSIIMVHNHPSGDPTPSHADVTMTKQVIAALEAVGIVVHDHVIVGKNRTLSFRSERLI